MDTSKKVIENKMKRTVEALRQMKKSEKGKQVRGKVNKKDRSKDNG